MIKLKTLLGEIALANHSPMDIALGKAMVQSLKPPAPFSGNREDKQEWMKYLQSLQEWAKQHIPPHGIILDIGQEKLYKASEDPRPESKFYLFSDDYESYEDFIEDQFNTPDVVWISTGQIARYLFGEDIADRIVIPGR